jgi:threonine dehydrogenase-like Zn-dependent dehydrogenase
MSWLLGADEHAVGSAGGIDSRGDQRMGIWIGFGEELALAHQRHVRSVNHIARGHDTSVSGDPTGSPTAGLFGYTHLTGGYPGGQAEYVRVPYADVGPVKVPNSLSDEQVLFLGDIFPTGWQAVVQCDLEPSETVAIWGCGPVGQFCIRSAILLGAKQVIAIDHVPERLSMARAGGATTINFDQDSVVERLNELTSGKGPEKCIDAVGMEAHATASLDSIYDRAKQAVMLETDRPHVLREMMYVCRPAGVLSVPGVYGGLLDKLPFGAVMNKGLTIRTGPTHVNRWTDDLLRRIDEGQIDPAFVITHNVGLEDLPRQGGRLHQGRAQAVRSNTMAHHDHGVARRGGSNGSALALAEGLGWFSVGLGLAELVAPERLARFLGMDEHAGLIRAYGVRELATGAGILFQDDPTP